MKATAVIKKVGGVSGTVGSAPSVSASLTKVGGASVIVDPALDPTSANPVENKAITEAIEEINGNLTSLDAGIDELAEGKQNKIYVQTATGDLLLVDGIVEKTADGVHGFSLHAGANDWFFADGAGLTSVLSTVNAAIAAKADAADIPTKTSDLTNNSGFITAAGAPVQSVNGATGAVTVSVPTKVSQLANDSGFVDTSGAAAASPVQSVNGQTGAVSLTIPTVPSKVSAFTNDAGYLTLADLPIYNGGVQ